MSRSVLLPRSESAGVRPALSISVETIAWAAVVTLFLGLRLGHVFLAPVGGAELAHLSGAWQAREGLTDDRFVPTLFQALSAAVLFFTTSELGPRLLGLLATASVLFAVYELRPEFGRAGALLAALFLSLDGLAVNLGASASASGFDVAVAAWLLVAALRPTTPNWAWGVLGFLVATAGPLPLALALAVAFLRLFDRRASLLGPRLYSFAAGAAAGAILASAGFGFGFEGIVVAPLELLAAGFQESWTTSTAFEAALLCSAPYLIAGAAIVAYHAVESRRGETLPPPTVLLLTWTAIAFIWLIASAGSHTTVPAVALTMPLALLLGPAAARGISAALHVDWRIAGPILAASALVLSIALYAMLDWARLNRVGPAGEVFVVAALIAVAAAGMLVLALRPGTAPALVVAAMALAAVPLIAASFGSAFGGAHEPLTSPYVSAQVRQLRSTAGQLAESGGAIVVHPSLADDATWPLRDLPVEVAGDPGEDAALVLWPAAQPAPAGLLPLDGTWALVRRVEPPVTSPLRYLRWLTNRNVLASHPESVSVYGRPPE